MARPRAIDDAKLLGAAKAVFVARGPEATTREIAAAARVSQGLLFQRYRTKERLFFAAMLPRPPRLQALVGPLPDPADAQSYLVGLATRLLQWLDDSMPGALRAALHPAFPAALSQTHTPPGAAGILAKITRRVQSLQRRGGLTPHIDAHATATALLGLLHGDALQAMLGRDRRAPPRERAERLVAILWQGLAPVKPRPSQRTGGDRG